MHLLAHDPFQNVGLSCVRLNGQDNGH